MKGRGKEGKENTWVGSRDGERREGIERSGRRKRGKIGMEKL
jgi:hypothetical protein